MGDRVRLLRNVMLHVGLVVPYEVKVGRDGGMPSGSALTNMVDSLVNYMVSLAVANDLGTGVPAITVLGDDAVVAFPGSPPMSEIVDAYSEYGLTVNADKSMESSDSCHFLQNLYLPELGYLPVRSVYRTLNGMLSYERFRNGWTKYMDTARWITRSEASLHYPGSVSYTHLTLPTIYSV